MESFYWEKGGASCYPQKRKDYFRPPRILLRRKRMTKCALRRLPPLCGDEENLHDRLPPTGVCQKIPDCLIKIIDLGEVETAISKVLLIVKEETSPKMESVVLLHLGTGFLFHS